MGVSLSLYPPFSLYLCRFISLISVILFLYTTCMYVYTCVYFFCLFFVSLCLCLYLSVCVSVSCYISTSLCLCLCRSSPTISVSLHLHLCLLVSVSVSLCFTSCPSPATTTQHMWAEGLTPSLPSQLLTPGSCSKLPNPGLSCPPLEEGVREEGRAAWRAHPFLPFQAGRLGQWAF